MRRKKGTEAIVEATMTDYFHKLMSDKNPQIDPNPRTQAAKVAGPFCFIENRIVLHKKVLYLEFLLNLKTMS